MRSHMLTDRSEIDAIIARTEVCFVGMSGPDHKPYVLPFNFGYDGEFLYLHSDPAGKKMDILAENPAVCIAFSTDHELFHRHEQVACSYGMRYRSVLIHGKVIFEDDSLEEKARILNIVMEKYTGRSDFKYSTPALKNVRTYKVLIEKIEGKVSDYK